MIILNPCFEDFEVLEKTKAVVSAAVTDNGACTGLVTSAKHPTHIRIGSYTAPISSVKLITVDEPTCRKVYRLSDDGWPGYTEQMIERLRGREDVQIDHAGLTGERSTVVTVFSYAAEKAYYAAAKEVRAKLAPPAPAPADPEALPGRIYKPTIEQLRELSSEDWKRFNLSAKNLHGETHIHEAVTIGTRTNLSGSVVAFWYYDESYESSVCPAEWIEWIEPYPAHVVPTPAEPEALPGRIYKPTIEQLRELASKEGERSGRRANIFVKDLLGEKQTYNAATFTFSESPISGMTIRVFPGGEVWPAELIEWIEPCAAHVAPNEAQPEHQLDTKEILSNASDTPDDLVVKNDRDGEELVVDKAVKAFNIVYETDLTVDQGLFFMLILERVRSLSKPGTASTQNIK